MQLIHFHSMILNYSSLYTRKYCRLGNVKQKSQAKEKG